MTEEERVRKIIMNMAKGEDFGHKLKFDLVSKTVKPVSIFDDPDEGMSITPEDATLFSLLEEI